MTTAAQVAANQRNASKSTGPRTTDGKKRSRMNAIRHGGYLHETDEITATFLREEYDEIQEVYHSLVEDLAPTSTLQYTLAAAIAQQIINQVRIGKLTAAAASGDELDPVVEKFVGPERHEYWYWENLSCTIGTRHDKAREGIPFGALAREIRERHPDADFPPPATIPAGTDYDDALEMSRAEVLRLAEVVYGPAEETFDAMMAVRYQKQDLADRETRFAHGLEAKRLIESFDKTSALQDRIARMIARDLKNYRELQRTEAELFDLDHDPEHDPDAAATKFESSAADPPRNEPNPNM